MRLPRITSDNRRWWILATMTGSLSMIMIDQTVVSVALPTMQRDLGLSQSGVQWVVNAYLLLLAMLVALGGRAGDLFGSQRMFRLGVAVFVAASAVCGLATERDLGDRCARRPGHRRGRDDPRDRSDRHQRLRTTRARQGDGHLRRDARWCSSPSARSSAGS